MYLKNMLIGFIFPLNFFLLSISPTFYARLFCQYFGAKNYKAESSIEKAALSTFVQKLLS